MSEINLSEVPFTEWPKEALKALGVEIMEIPYSIDFRTGEFVCGLCHKRFPAYYWRKKEYGRTISREMHGAASANFIKHQKSCYRKYHEKTAQNS